MTYRLTQKPKLVVVRSNLKLLEDAQHGGDPRHAEGASLRDKIVQALEDIMKRRETPSPELKSKQDRLLAILAARKAL